MKKLGMLMAVLACGATLGACSAPITAPEARSSDELRTPTAPLSTGIGQEDDSTMKAGGFGMGGGG